MKFLGCQGRTAPAQQGNTAEVGVELRVPLTVGFKVVLRAEREAGLGAEQICHD